jgi:hypothetical protein
LLVHPLAGNDRLGGEPYDLTVFAHRFVRLDGRDRHLVAARDALARRYAGHFAPGGNLIHRDNDIVTGRQANEARIGQGKPPFRSGKRITAPGQGSGAARFIPTRNNGHCPGEESSPESAPAI